MNLKQLEKKLIKNKFFRKEYFKRDFSFEVGQELIKLRVSRGISQIRLAKLLNTKQPAIARIESGKNLPSLRTLKKIADVLKVNLEPPRFVESSFKVKQNSKKGSENLNQEHKYTLKDIGIPPRILPKVNSATPKAVTSNNDA